MSGTLHIFVGFLVFGLIISPALAATAQGASAVGGATSNASEQFSRQGGAENNIHYVLDLNITAKTLYWAGLYGNVSGQVGLRGSANKSVFDWFSPGATGKNVSSQDVYSAVIATNSSAVPGWANLGANPFSGSQLDTRLGLNPGAKDAASNVFTGTSSTFILGNKTISSTSSAASCTNYFVNNDSSVYINDTFFQTVALNDPSNQVVLATLVRPVASNIYVFNNATQANFEMTLFANNSATYYFYIELR